MKKSPAWCWAAKISWAVTALASINIGSAVFFDIDFFQMQFMMNPSFGQLVFAFIGLCGLFSFTTFVMHCTGDCKSCKV